MIDESLPAAVRRAVEAGDAAAGVAGSWEPQYGVYADLAPEVLRTADLETFLRGCAATNRFAVLLTDPDAALSPFVVGALRDHEAFWVTHRPGSPVRDARTGRELTSYEQLWREPAAPCAGGPRGDATVLAFDVVAEHRADERTQIGPLAADVIGLLDGRAPLMSGPVEPVTEPFSVGRITATARAQMPDADPVLVRGEHSWAEIAVTRTATGVREHVRGGVAQADAERQQDVAVEALTALAASQQRVLTATVSSLRTAAGGAWRAGAQHPERLLAAYVGPAVLGRTRRDPATLAADLGGRLVGRAQVPGLLLPLAGSTEDRLTGYLDLVRALAQEGDGDDTLGA